MEIPKMTPWGEPDHVKVLADGIVFFYTPSHGGYWLSKERNEQVPLWLRLSTFFGNGLNGWYEEDCDAEIVEAVFSEEF